MEEEEESEVGLRLLDVISEAEQFQNDNDGQLYSRLTRITISKLSYEDRLLYWRPKAGHFIASILQQENHDVQIYVRCWEIILESLKLNNRSTDVTFEEIDTICFCALELNILQVMAQELGRNPLRVEVLGNMLVCLTTIALVEDCCEEILKNGLVELLFPIVRDHSPNMIGLLSLISLTNLGIHSKSHERLLEVGSIELCLHFFNLYENSTDPDEMDCGITSGFLVCRVIGKDETRTEMIHANQNLINKLYWIFEQVLIAGPTGTFLGSHWNPANIVLDMSILSYSELNRPYLGKFVPLLIRGLREYGSVNARLVKFSVQVFFNLITVPEAKHQMDTFLDSLVLCLRNANKGINIDLQTFQQSSAVLTYLTSTRKTSIAFWFQAVSSRISNWISFNLGGRFSLSNRRWREN